MATTILRPSRHLLNQDAVRELREAPNELSIGEKFAQTLSLKLRLVETYITFGEVTPAEISGNHTAVTFFIPTNNVFE